MMTCEGCAVWADGRVQSTGQAEAAVPKDMMALKLDAPMAALATRTSLTEPINVAVEKAREIMEEEEEAFSQSQLPVWRSSSSHSIEQKKSEPLLKIAANFKSPPLMNVEPSSPPFNRTEAADKES